MSAKARNDLVNSGHLFFQQSSQKTDLLNVNITQTELIAALQYIIGKGYHLELTAVCTDHHDDTEDNPIAPYVGTHEHGWSVDCWPLTGPKMGAYLDANDSTFQQFLRDCAGAPFLMQIGLGGSAYTSANADAAGESVFHDDIQDHVHIGTE